MDILGIVILGIILLFGVGLVWFFGQMFIAQVRPTHRCLIERFGKFSRFAVSGLVVCIPIIERIRLINVTEKMVSCQRQEVITGDNLNAGVSAQVYYKIKGTEEGVRNSQYNVNDVHSQIVSLAQTTLRNVIGSLTLREANSKRAELNISLKDIIAKETANWGIEVVRCEIAEIKAPDDVQKAMNEIVKAESEKRAAIDYASAVETQADGKKRSEIKAAEGRAKAINIEADAKANAIRVVNDAANETFKGPAVQLKMLEVGENVFKNNSKIIVPAGTSVTTLVSDLTGAEKIIPLDKQ